MERSEIKARAREQIKGNIGILFVISLVMGIILGVTSFTAIGGLIVAGPLALSMAFIYKGMADGVKPSVGNLMDGFKNNFAAAIIASILQSIFLALWAFLLFIPAFIKTYSYSMTFYVLADNPEMTATEAITESRRIMNGNKFKLFVQHLSFIGWSLLCLITFGIAFIWVGPYMAAADYNFYLSIKENN